MKAGFLARHRLAVRVLLVAVLIYPLTAAAPVSRSGGFPPHGSSADQCALPISQRTGGWTCFGQ